MTRLPRKLRFHWRGDGLPPTSGDYLELPTGTAYLILSAKPGRKEDWFIYQVIRVDPEPFPEGSTVFPMVWVKR